jgi:Family of unknown function (DUF6499)
VKTKAVAKDIEEYELEFDFAEVAKSLVPRRDWKEASSYPQPQDTNSTMWAWEFLRRNAHYQSHYDDLVQQKAARSQSHEALERYQQMLEVGWNVNDLLSPELNYAQYNQKDSQRIEDFKFSGQTALIGFPRFHAGEFAALSRISEKLNDPFIGASETTTLVAANEVLVKFCLDGNIDRQLEQVRDHLNTPQFESDDLTEPFIATPHEFRMIVLERSVVAPEQVGSDTSDEFVFGTKVAPIKVKIGHLWCVLRIADALGTLAASRNYDEFCGDVLTHFNNEREQRIPEVKFFEKSVEQYVPLLRKSTIENYVGFALRYSLSQRYVAVAHADLSGQLAKIRSVKKNKK